MRSLLEHLLARAQGAPQPAERPGAGRCSSSTRSRWRSTSQATGTSSEVNNASIAFVDEDQSALSKELINAFYPPRFQHPQLIAAERGRQPRWTAGSYMFVVAIPPRFEHDLRAGRNPTIQVNIDATAMQQAGIGAGYIKNIINDRVSIVPPAHGRQRRSRPSTLVIRKLFNPNGESVLVHERRGHHQPDHAC